MSVEWRVQESGVKQELGQESRSWYRNGDRNKVHDRKGIVQDGMDLEKMREKEESPGRSRISVPEKSGS